MVFVLSAQLTLFIALIIILRRFSIMNIAFEFVNIFRFANWIANLHFSFRKLVETLIADSCQDGHKFTALYCLYAIMYCKTGKSNASQSLTF